MRGFLVGTFGIAVLYAVVQKGADKRITDGTGLVAGAFQRLTGATTAGVPLKKSKSSTGATTTAPPSGNYGEAAYTSV